MTCLLNIFPRSHILAKGTAKCLSDSYMQTKAVKCQFDQSGTGISHHEIKLDCANCLVQTICQQGQSQPLGNDSKKLWLVLCSVLHGILQTLLPSLDSQKLLNPMTSLR